ncbi:hypothetical protein EYF80_005982 [Liparis tanakae]|uniref:Uncharacterized protein n=1 Tax=Liparis tanakae TaxID=230148 RepID=A0A4Z2J0W8_9TELE|nr:hypothetical protein EYF80_005982 [Liparis tanakae]
MLPDNPDVASDTCNRSAAVTLRVSRYLLRRVTSRQISIFIISFADFKVSAGFSERWGSATRKLAQIAKHEVFPGDQISI